MDYNRNSWSLTWMHPLLSALATNPAFYYYYTAKADLLNQDEVDEEGGWEGCISKYFRCLFLEKIKTCRVQWDNKMKNKGFYFCYRIVIQKSIMVRRGNQRVSKKLHSNAQVQSSASTPPALPFGTLGSGSGGNNVTLRQHGIEACPQCQTLFNNSNCRPVQEACGHIKCRSCFISNDDGCPQCREAERPRRGPPSVTATTSRRSNDVQNSKGDDLDLMPPLLTVEEPLVSTGIISTDKGLMAGGQLKELPPVLSSVATASAHSKSPLKRKPSRDFNSSAPTKVQKTSIAGRTSSSKTGKDSDPRERPKSRRSSTGSGSRNDQRGTSPKGSGFYSRQGTQDRSNRYGNAIGSDSSSSGFKKRSRVEARNTHDTMPTINQDIPTAMTSANSVPQQKEKPNRLSSLRSSTGSSSGASSSTGRWGQQASSSRRKEPDQMVGKPKMAFNRQENKDDKTPSFAMTISPTTLKPQQKSTVMPTTLTTIPLISPSKSTSRTEEVLSMPFSRAVPASKPDMVLPGSSNFDGSNSNSLETCDPLFIRNEWQDSNSADGQGSTPTESSKKKKKRSPVTIHDHITILSGVEPLLYQCNVCMKKFKTKAHIKYHEFCQNGEKPYKCETCGQGFIAKSHYEYHLRTHTGERPYVCPKCGKGFNQRGKVTRHMRSHTGEKPFICQQCGRGFANAQALRSHFLIHTGERPFACQYCNKRFTGMTNLKKHVITHTGERPFSCTHCGKSFGLKWTLDLHLRTHSTERPFACDQCTRAFSNSKDLRRHLVIHSGERPFKCWICGTAFRRKDNLDRHIKNTHNQPKEVAKQLANEAAAEYMAQSKTLQALNNSVKCAGTKKGATSAAGKKGPSQDPVPGPSREMNQSDPTSENTGENMGVIITADLSPPSSPSTAGAGRSVDMGTEDMYLLPNGQPDIPEGSLITQLGSGDGKSDGTHEVSVQVFDGLAELRTVPVSEYHQIEGIELLEKAKTTSDPVVERKILAGNSNSAVVLMDKDQKPLIDGGNDLLFCGNSDAAANGSQNFNHGLTVTVVYENDGKTHFITDPTAAYPAGVAPLNFPADQSGVLSIGRDAMFSFGPNDPQSIDEENQVSDDSGSPPQRRDIQQKKSETILSGNLSKFLQMDLPKNVYVHSDDGSKDSSLNTGEGESEQNLTETLCEPANNEGSAEFVGDGRAAEDVARQHIQRTHLRSIIKEENMEVEEHSESDGFGCKVSSYPGAQSSNAGSTNSDNSVHRPNLSNEKSRSAADNLHSSFRNHSNNEVEIITPNSNNKLGGPVLIFKHEIEDVDYDKGKLNDLSRQGSKNHMNQVRCPPHEGSKLSKESTTKDSAGDSAVQERLDYPSDPMFQEHIADDDDKLQQATVESDNQMELSHDNVDKESVVDSILPDGIESYGSPETIFQEKIVDSGHKLEENNTQIVLLKDIVDKECPASILQDDTSNCGSVDPISDDEDDFNDALPEHESPEIRSSPSNSTCLEPNKLQDSQKASVDVVLTKESIREDFFARSRARENDTESISSTELEPMPDDRKTYEREFEGIVDEECPHSILQGDEDDSSDEVDHPDNPEIPEKEVLSNQTFGDKENPSGSVSEKLEEAPSECFSPEVETESRTQFPHSGKSEELSEGNSTEGPPKPGSKDDEISGRDHLDQDSAVQLGADSDKQVTLGSRHDGDDLETQQASIIGTSEQELREANDVEPISDTELEDLNESEGTSLGNTLPTIELNKVSKSPIDICTPQAQDPGSRQQLENDQQLHRSSDDENITRDVRMAVHDANELTFKSNDASLEANRGQQGSYKRRGLPEQPIKTPANFDHAAVELMDTEDAEEGELVDSPVACENDDHQASEHEYNDMPAVAITETSNKEANEGDETLATTQDDMDEEAVETAEKSTQCVQAEDDNDFDFDECTENLECLKKDSMNSGAAMETVDSPIASDGADLSTDNQVESFMDQTPESVTKSPLNTNRDNEMVVNPSSPEDGELNIVPGASLKMERQMEDISDDGDEYSEEESMETCSTAPENMAENNILRSSVAAYSSESSLKTAAVTYLPVPHSSQTSISVPSEARLIFTNSLTNCGGESSQACRYTQSSNVVSYSNVVNPVPTETTTDNNYSFVYAPDASSSTSSYPTTQSSFRFVYDNGEPVTDTDPLDNNMRIVYACAAAAADPPGDSPGPQKLKLLYAEALGVGTPDDSGQVQLVYTSTAPNQNVVRGPNQNVQIYSPTLISTDSSTNAENIQMLFAQQPQLEQNSAPVPVEVLYNGNGTVMAQTVGHPQDLSWLKRDLNHTFATHSSHSQPHDKHLVTYTTASNTRTSANPITTREIANHHNYASPYLNIDNSKRVRLPAPLETEADGLRTLARAAATRMFSIQADADATTRAAAAIAAVGREAQIKRQLDILERSRNLPGTAVFMRKGENVPHRGPRKRYLSQLTNSRK